MAFLNTEERAKLRQDLQKMSFGAAKRKLHRLDPKARLVYLRNNQRTGVYYTRFELPGMGTRVTLVEHFDMDQKADGRFMSDFEFVDVVVEPTPENKM